MAMMAGLAALPVTHALPNLIMVLVSWIGLSSVLHAMGPIEEASAVSPNLAARLHAWQVDDLGYNYPGYHNSEVLAIACKHLGRRRPVTLF